MRRRDTLVALRMVWVYASDTIIQSLTVLTSIFKEQEHLRVLYESDRKTIFQNLTVLSVLVNNICDFRTVGYIFIYDFFLSYI